MSESTEQLLIKLKVKLKASFIHLCISFLIFLLILYFILFEWYPEPFFTAQGGWQGIRLMAFVDLVLGPALTLIVFDHLKARKYIIFDLSIIALVQISALIWGGHNVYTQRPVALVFWANAFYTVTSDDYSGQNIELPDFLQYSSNTPPLIYSRPINTKLENTLSMQMTANRIPIYSQVMFYEPFIENIADVFKYQLDINEVLAKNATMKAALLKVVGSDIDKYKYITLKAKYQNMILIFNDEGELVGEVKAPYHS